MVVTDKIWKLLMIMRSLERWAALLKCMISVLTHPPSSIKLRLEPKTFVDSFKGRCRHRAPRFQANWCKIFSTAYFFLFFALSCHCPIWGEPNTISVSSTKTYRSLFGLILDVCLTHLAIKSYSRQVVWSKEGASKIHSCYALRWKIFTPLVLLFLPLCKLIKGCTRPDRWTVQW